jgi:hypothetical protein
MGGKTLNRPIVAIAATPDGGGYWEVASDGGIFAFGDAHYYGSMGGTPLNKPIVGITATPDGGGYWEVASDGGIFAFGDANYYGSMGGKPLNKPIVGIAVTHDGGGYWEVASDGGIFTFGDATFYGSMGGVHLNKPVVAMWSAGNGQGYWEAASDGGIFNFGNAAPFLGSTGGINLNAPVVGGALTPTLPTASITLTKSTTSTGYGAAGQTIGYNYLVTNSGNATLNNVSVSDNKNAVSCPSSTLSKGASETCTGTYVVTQADVDSGSVTNTASASANGPENISVSSSPAIVTVVASSATSSFNVTESSPSQSPSGYGAAGEAVTFNYDVTNTGTTTLHDIAVADSVTNAIPDPAVPLTVNCPSGNVAPGQTVACTSTYTTVQDDVDSGSIVTSAAATAVNPGGHPVDSSGAPASVTVDGTFAVGSLSVSSTPSPASFTASGQTIDFSYQITNTGTLSLTEISLTDSVQGTGAPITVDCSGVTSSTIIGPGQSVTCTGSYVTTGADVTSAGFSDSALASAFDVLNFNQWTAFGSSSVAFQP